MFVFRRYQKEQFSLFYSDGTQVNFLIKNISGDDGNEQVQFVVEAPNSVVIKRGELLSELPIKDKKARTEPPKEKKQKKLNHISTQQLEEELARRKKKRAANQGLLTFHKEIPLGKGKPISLDKFHKLKREN